MRTFLDSGVLMLGWRGEPREKAAAISTIEAPEQSLLASEMVRLELLPKPIYFKQKAEVEFYESIFSRCECDAVDAELYASAFRLARRYGLSAAEAFNLASAVRLKADEFVTTEQPGKPMFRVKELKVVTLHAAASARS
jgi:predicted nucleic acid-binding protein